MNIWEDIIQAEQRIRPYIRTTPLEYSFSLSKLTGSRVYLKLENLQYTGSFKVRGAMNALLLLTSAERTCGVVTASSGNHGIATAFGLSTLKMQGSIFVPQNTSPTKMAAIQQYGVDLRQWGEDSVVTEAYARAYAAEHEMVYISPYNDWRVVSGQGTIGMELCRQNGQIDVVLVAVGGGGMISGIAESVKTVFPQAEVIGCSPENSPVMARSVQAGQLLDMESLPTLSDGTAGGVEAGAITFPLCQRLVDDFLLVSEEEIRQAIRLCLETHHMLIEGAAGVSLAALLKTAERFRDKTVIVVVCGANMSVDTLKTIL
ncbi:MAG TPA: threonine/serine dehydratase [Ktedonobacteraceae bacterium]